MNHERLTGCRAGRRAALAAALLVAWILAPVASADEPPPGGGDFPPPVAAQPEEAPPADTPPVAAEGDANWSRPAAPGARPGTPAPANATLPPPRIVRRRSGPTSAPVTAPGPTPASAPIRTPYIRDVPTRAPAAPGLSPTPIAARRMPGTSPRAAVPSRGVPRGGPACRVLKIEKTHNVEASDIESGVLFLRFDVEYEVRGQQGRDVYVGIWFARVTDGRLVQSTIRRFADSAGNVTLQTRWTRMGDNVPRRYAATLLIPYAAFPVHETGESYQIEARVQVLRNAGSGRVTALARDKTTFRVYGMPPEDAREEPEGPVLDRVGADMATSGGFIVEPGIPTGAGAGDTAGESGRIVTPGRQDGSGSQATPGETGVIEDLPPARTPAGK